MAGPHFDRMRRDPPNCDVVDHEGVVGAGRRNVLAVRAHAYAQHAVLVGVLDQALVLVRVFLVLPARTRFKVRVLHGAAARVLARHSGMLLCYQRRCILVLGGFKRPLSD
eukprot:2037865-Rhodomonas_salina.2